MADRNGRLRSDGGVREALLADQSVGLLAGTPVTEPDEIAELAFCILLYLASLQEIIYRRLLQQARGGGVVGIVHLR